MGVFSLKRGRANNWPASISNPVQGTSLTAVANISISGATGPRAAYSNGTWSGSPDAYLTAQGFTTANSGRLFWNIGASSKSVANYDFTGCPGVDVDGTGTATFTDCKFATTANLAMPRDTNGTINYDTGTLTVICNYCVFNLATWFMGSGTTTFSYCRFTQQVQGLGDVGFNGLGTAILTYDHCHITGGGINPAASAHVELTQMSRSGTSFTCTNTFVDISTEGQTTTASWGSGWTGVWAPVGDFPSTFTNCIMIGAIAVNANAANPNVVSCLVAYGTGSTPTLTNCVMEVGVNGYTKNQSGTGTRPADGGGNRSYANAALTVADFS